MVAELERIFSEAKVVELGHVFEENMPAHPTQSKFYKLPWHRVGDGEGCNDNQLLMHEHNGTHVDSFRHFINKEGFELIDQMGLEYFNGPCISIEAAHVGKNGLVTKEDVIAREEKYGSIREGDIVLIDTGWEKYWKLHPEDDEFRIDYPGIAPEAAEYFVEKGVRLVGIDTMAADPYCSADSPTHQILLSSRVPIVENLCNLKELHGKRGYFLMLPLRIKDGTASPVRPVALIDG